MDHWRQVLPGKVLTLQYEDLVMDLESHVRQLLDHCELPFEESCLRFWETDRPVRTASSEQVRQPITYSGYNPDPRLVDVARIEALSGPQGTLFGDAAQCGTLRIITNKPDTTAQDGWVDLTAYSITDGEVGYDLSGMTNVPLVDDKVAIRLVGFYASDAGWVDNVLAPSPGQQFDNAHRVEDDVDSSVWYGGRASLRVLPGDNWTVDLTGIYQYYELDGFAGASLNIGHYADRSVYPTFDHDEQARFTEDYWEDEWYQFATTLEGNLEAGDLVFTANYFSRDSVYFADATAYPQSYQLEDKMFYATYSEGFRRGGANSGRPAR